MWNLMDWTNFVLYGVLYMGYRDTRAALDTYYCSLICQRVGFHDPWQVIEANTRTKQVIAIITTIQWIKVVKFVNMFVPKFSLATSVLSHALADLLLFGVVFVWSIVSFAQLFYMQLGPYMRGYSSQTLAILTLARALFGDFDIEAVIDSSSSMINLIMFLSYLFFAVFILLSIFLTILGEHQGFVRDDQLNAKDDESENVDEWGVLATAKNCITDQVRKLAKRNSGGIGSASADCEPNEGLSGAAVADSGALAPAAAKTKWNLLTMAAPSRAVQLEAQVQAFEETFFREHGRPPSAEEYSAVAETQRQLDQMRTLEHLQVLKKEREVLDAPTVRITDQEGNGASTCGDRNSRPARGLFGTYAPPERADAEAIASLMRDLGAIKDTLDQQSEMMQLLLHRDRNHTGAGAISSRFESGGIASKVVSAFELEGRIRRQYRGTGSCSSRSQNGPGASEPRVAEEDDKRGCRNVSTSSLLISEGEGEGEGESPRAPREMRGRRGERHGHFADGVHGGASRREGLNGFMGATDGGCINAFKG